MKILPDNPLANTLDDSSKETKKLKQYQTRMEKGEKISLEDLNATITKLKAVSELAANPNINIPGIGQLGRSVHKRIEAILKIVEEDTNNPAIYTKKDGFIWRTGIGDEE